MYAARIEEKVSREVIRLTYFAGRVLVGLKRMAETMTPVLWVISPATGRVESGADGWSQM